MKNLKQRTSSRNGSAAEQGAWRKWLLAGGALGTFGCGDLDYTNYVPLPSRKDGSADSMRDGSAKPDTVSDKGAKDAGPDALKPDGASIPDGALHDGLAKDAGVEALAADATASDACVALSKALSCSNAYPLASGWLALGGSLDLKSAPPYVQVIYKLKLESVETLGGTTSAVVSIADSCGKVLKKEKVAVKGTKTVVLSGTTMHITADEVYGGFGTFDAGAQTGLAKISVTAPCNLDMGMADAKLSDYKVASFDSYKPDAQAMKPDAQNPKPDMAKPDASIAADAAKADAQKPDMAKPDASIAADAAKADAQKPKPDSTIPGDFMAAADKGATDSWQSCATSATGIFFDQIFAGSPVAVGGYTFDYKGLDKSGNALFDISCGSSPLASGMAFPVYTKSTIQVPADGKKIEVTPYTSTSGWTDVKIEVKKQ